MNPSGADVSNAIVALGTEGLQYYNAVSNNVFPTTSLVTTPGGPSVISGSTGTSTTIILILGLLIVAAYVLFKFVL